MKNSLKRKSLKRKSLKQKSLKRKSLKRKSLNKKTKSYSPEAIAAYTGTVLGLGALGASIYSINKNNKKNLDLQDKIIKLQKSDTMNELLRKNISKKLEENLENLEIESEFLNKKINQIAADK